VFGLEAQGDWADLNNTRVSLFDPTLSTSVKTNGIGLFTGQIGYAWNAALLYGGCEQHLHQRGSIRALRPYSVTGSAKMWIWSPRGSTIASAAGALLPLLPVTDLLTSGELEPRHRPGLLVQACILRSTRFARLHVPLSTVAKCQE
jgi:hypothetical protein